MKGISLFLLSDWAAILSTLTWSSPLHPPSPPHPSAGLQSLFRALHCLRLKLFFCKKKISYKFRSSIKKFLPLMTSFYPWCRWELPYPFIIFLRLCEQPLPSMLFHLWAHCATSSTLSPSVNNKNVTNWFQEKNTSWFSKIVMYKIIGSQTRPWLSQAMLLFYCYLLWKFLGQKCEPSEILRTTALHGCLILYCLGLYSRYSQYSHFRWPLTARGLECVTGMISMPYWLALIPRVFCSIFVIY